MGTSRDCRWHAKRVSRRSHFLTWAVGYTEHLRERVVVQSQQQQQKKKHEEWRGAGALTVRYVYASYNTCTFWWSINYQLLSKKKNVKKCHDFPNNRCDDLLLFFVLYRCKWNILGCQTKQDILRYHLGLFFFFFLNMGYNRLIIIRNKRTWNDWLIDKEAFAALLFFCGFYGCW